jgi:hypothetical protein
MRRAMLASVMLWAACGSGDSTTQTTKAGAAERVPEPDASPFGASCGQDDECTPGRCVDFRCSVSCDPEDARACRDVTGLCARVRNGARACVGDLSTGEDRDDGVVHGASTHSATLQPGDLDVFRLALPAGRWKVSARPTEHLDLALDFYDPQARPIGAFDDALAGGTESTAWLQGEAFVVVRHVAGHGAYVFEAAHE